MARTRQPARLSYRGDPHHRDLYRKALATFSPKPAVAEAPLPHLMDVYGTHIRQMLALGGGVDPDAMARGTEQLESFLDQVEAEYSEMQNALQVCVRERMAACNALEVLAAKGRPTAVLPLLQQEEGSAEEGCIEEDRAEDGSAEHDGSGTEYGN